MVHILLANRIAGVLYTHCGLEYQPSLPTIKYEKPIGEGLANIGKHLCGKCIAGGGK